MQVMSQEESVVWQCAKPFRLNMTDAENLLWSRLKGVRAPGDGFIWQFPIGPFVADFACADTGIAIEIESAAHSSEAEMKYEAALTHYLGERGWRVVRLQTHEVYEHLEGVVSYITDAI
ncbi:MAG TPA: endonuclease domain-containing protein [Rhizomicrobium sp.]|nr:endonuclease domain-containing protein [Rhizomicrobium sp.]